MRNSRLIINKISIIVLAMALCFTANLTFTQEDVRTLGTKVADVLAQFPAQSAEERDELASEIVQLGPEGIREISQMLVPLFLRYPQYAPILSRTANR